MKSKHTIQDLCQLTYMELLEQDTRSGLYDSLSGLGLKVHKNAKKSELVNLLYAILSENPFRFIDILPKDEQDLLSKLIGSKQSEYVEVPISEQRLGLQIHHLVVTETMGDKWRLYMPDSIRQHIDKCAMSNLSAYPGMQEWNDAMAVLNKLQKQVEEDVRFNPTILPIQQLPLYLQRLRDEVKELDKLQKKLQRLEPQIKQYNIDFTNVFSSIRESKRQCETKLALMGMFRWG